MTALLITIANTMRKIIELNQTFRFFVERGTSDIQLPDIRRFRARNSFLHVQLGGCGASGSHTSAGAESNGVRVARQFRESRACVFATRS